MAKTIKQTEVPAFTVVQRTSKWASIIAQMADLLESKTRDDDALVFDASDGITKENYGSAAQACRNIAKKMGCKILVRWDDANKLLYAFYDSPFVARGKRATTSASSGSGASTTSRGKTSAAKTASTAKSGSRR